jgi:hypothetical protein
MREQFRHHIPVSKVKCFFYLFPALLIGLSGPFAAYGAFLQDVKIGLFNGACILLSPLTLSIGLQAAFSLGRKLVDPKSGLTITDEGVFIDSSPFNRHFLRWTEVESIHRTHATIEVRAIGSAGFTTLKTGLLRSKKPRTTIHITTDCLKASYDEIAEALRTHQSRPLIDDRPSL